MNSNASKHLPRNGKYNEMSHLSQLAARKQSSSQTKHKKTLREGLIEIYYEYCANTSVHGVQYLGQNRPWKEIIFWLAQVYHKWNDTPVIVSFSERSIPVSDIPFPAITICPEIRRKVADDDGPSFSELLSNLTFGLGIPDNLTQTQLEEFLTLLHTCNTDVYSTNIPRLSNTTIDYIRIINTMSMGFAEQAVVCKWFGLEDECSDLLTKTYTDNGLCYTFNGFNGTDLYRENTVQYQLMGLENHVNKSAKQRINRTLNWSLEEGYPKNAPLKTYPARVVSASTRAAFEAGLRVLTDNIDYSCSLGTEGFKIVLHTPNDVPLLSKRFVRISPHKEVAITVKPVMLTTSDGVANYSPEKRKCFLNRERYLKFFKVYSERNCEMECLTNYTLQQCGCVKFSMPRTADMPICSEDKIHCYIQAEDKMLLENFGNRDKDACNCMPSCTSLEYDVELAQSDFSEKQIFSAFRIEDVATTKWSHLIVHFKENQFITSKRSVLFGFTDFLGNCGGVLGLFMGFSILSLIEWFYHITLRLWSNMRSRKRQI
ncbi:pickpocket protein 28-like [Musca vetustissima]|uniref:pickpocket protein 28-like n=1 Tax=Musca vetustissima TaxID=27455 RepID=UPI002AB6B166|nr:pickpocket protein 28-like [Musca vetustissima]